MSLQEIVMDERMREYHIEWYCYLQDRVKFFDLNWSKHNSTTHQIRTVSLLLEHKVFPRITVCTLCDRAMPLREDNRKYECDCCNAKLSWKVGSIFERDPGIKPNQMIGLLGVTLFLREIVRMWEIVDYFQLLRETIDSTTEEFGNVFLWHKEKMRPYLSEEDKQKHAYDYFLDSEPAERRLDRFFSLLVDYHEEELQYKIRAYVRKPQGRFQLLHYSREVSCAKGRNIGDC